MAAWYEQRYTVSAGASYTYKDTTVDADMLYGSGLRDGFANTEELPGYYPVNPGFTYTFHLPEKYGQIQFRFDVTLRPLSVAPQSETVCQHFAAAARHSG